MENGGVGDPAAEDTAPPLEINGVGGVNGCGGGDDSVVPSNGESAADCQDVNGDSDEAETDDEEEEEEEEEVEKCFRLVAPHKMHIGQPGLRKAASVCLTGMEFNPPTQTLMITTKTVIGDSVTYAVSRLRPSAAAASGAAPGKTAGGGLATLGTMRYRASLDHHGDLRIASCGPDAPGELVCAGSDRAGGRHGVFRLQALPATSQPVLAQCCGPAGPRLGQFNRPAGCAVDSGCVYVADRLNHRVQRLALPTLAPLAAFRHPRMVRPSHVAVFSDPHYARRLLLVAHERGVLAFDLATSAAPAVGEFARSRARRWGGCCVHWGAVLLADQDGNCIRVYRYRPEMADGLGGFGLVQRLPLGPLGLCLPRGLTTHRWQDLLFLAAHDTAAAGGDVCVLTARLARPEEQEPVTQQERPLDRGTERGRQKKLLDEIAMFNYNHEDL